MKSKQSRDKMSKIGIFDSGIGGLTILKEIQKKCKEEDYYYYADGIHNPYGEKSEKELNKIVDNISHKQNST